MDSKFLNLESLEKLDELKKKDLIEFINNFPELNDLKKLLETYLINSNYKLRMYLLVMY